jgi:hypothetical protein
MARLNPDQTKVAVETMRMALAEKTPEGALRFEGSLERDKERVLVIREQLTPLLTGFLRGEVPLADFKSRADGINKKHDRWGFSGFKGQMFFNMLTNAAGDAKELAEQIKAAIAKPNNEEDAAKAIRRFAQHVEHVRERFVENGGTRHGCPKPGSIPFFLSYFWQVQDRDAWPVYYTNSVHVLTDLNLMQPKDDLAEDYVAFKQLHHELERLFTEASGRKFGPYEVEHVLWIKGQKPDVIVIPPPVVPPPGPQPTLDRLPDSYVPPIIAILPRMAQNEPQLCEAAKASGTSLDRAFEKNIHAAFTMLGYECKLLGQGQGRVPDGQALDLDGSYAILWDAKIRAGGYNLGTDDRAIHEYVTKQSRELARRQSIRNIYYLIVSSSFTDNYEDAVAALKMETDVNEVCLVQADAVVAMVEAKLREPRQITLGPDGLQRLFCRGGIITADDVRKAVE